MSRLAPLLTCLLAAGACGGEVSGSGAPHAPSTTPDADAKAPDAPAAPEFVMAIHADTVGVQYEYEAFLERFARGAGPEVARIDECDVESVSVGPAPSPVIGLRLTSASGARLRGVLEAAQETQPFTVTVRDERLFAGVVYSSYGAAAIRSPVVHVSVGDDAVVLHVGAIQGAAFLKVTPAEAARIDRSELRDVFRRLGKLREGASPPVP